MSDPVFLITGASSGIGAELARQLGPRADRLVLTARRTERLEALRAAILRGSPRLEVHVEPCDLSDLDATEAFAGDVASRFGPLDILVNNAGFGDYSPYDLAEWETVQRMIRVNVIAPALLTRRFIPPMVERRRGGILNIGSGAGITIMPAAAAYVGTKHFLHGFTEALRLDMTGTGVVVTEVCPGPVETEFDERAGIDVESAAGLPPIFRISAERCAREAISGFEKGDALVFPGSAYRALMALESVTPASVQRRAMRGRAQQARAEAERGG